MLEFKLNHVSKRGPGKYDTVTINVDDWHTESEQNGCHFLNNIFTLISLKKYDMGQITKKVRLSYYLVLL